MKTNTLHQSIKIAVQNDRIMQAKIINMRLCWDMSIILLMGLNLLYCFICISENLVTIGDFDLRYFIVY